MARLWDLRDVVLLSSAYALEEARRNLPLHAQLQRLEKLSSGLEIVECLNTSALPPQVSLPSKDAPILAAALAASATHLITGDHKHFGRYFGAPLAEILVLPPGEYLNKT